MTRYLLILQLLRYILNTYGDPISRTLSVHAIIRHGDRTPDGSIIYPNDPYQNETYRPYGLGQLTKQGKRTQYNLGKFLRSKYRHLIDDFFAPNVVYARSTDISRTKMSLQLVLAGLFPPTGEEIWDSDVEWQPIPYDHSPSLEDDLLFGMLNPLWDINYVAYIISLTLQGYFEPYEDVFRYLSQHSGWPFSTFFYAFNLYFILVAQEEWGLALPEWTRDVYPDILRNMTLQEYSLMVGTDSLKSIMAGRLLQKIVADSISKINGTLSSEERSIFLYLGHEINVATTLLTLGIQLPEIPSYGACVLFELHQRREIFGIELYYKKGKEDEVIPLQIPGCELFCSLDSFVSLVEKFFP